CSGLTSVEIPSSVTSIGEAAFDDCRKLQTINFTGSIRQWNRISKEISWSYGIPATVVHCTNGDVSLE
ncbi:leucine-rich repeat protein, partial [uncultured Treponema sp.]